MVQTQPSRLSIIHVLGWMAGTSVVLACYRLVDFKDLPSEALAPLRLLQMLLAIAYGAGLGGLAMLIWRRWRGGARFPSQPGHWLLVLGSLGCLADGGVYLTIRAALKFGLLTPSPWHWQLHQTMVWTAATLIGAVVAFRSRGAGHWGVFASVATFILACNALVYGLATILCEMAKRGAGWRVREFTLLAFELPTYVRLGGESLGAAALFWVLWKDRQEVADRDWAHWAGVLVALALASIDVVQNVWDWRAW